MSTVRLFIALELSQAVKRALADIAALLGGRYPAGAIRWVGPENQHLTVRFLGDTATSTVPAIGRVLDEAGRSHSAFSLQMGAGGCFPSCRRPRVLWVGLNDHDPLTGGQLAAFKSSIDSGLTALGLPPDDKPFRAHLTLGRVKDANAVRDIDWDVPIPALDFPANTIHLIESKLNPSGPTYITRHSSRLTG